MGFAIAVEAGRRGADVTLVAGPTAIEPPAAGTVVKVRGAREMHQAVLDRADRMDAIVMAAAVADYTPVERASQKVHKSGETLTLVLEKTPDILGDLGRRRLASGRGPVLVGFAAETEHLIPQATAKREMKHVDFIVANDVSREDSGFDVETNAVTIVGADGVEALPLQSKASVAAAILDRVEQLLATKPAPGNPAEAGSHV
jgi:phosphopantothenoylcysteine decarboxylase/phosphopantothenate--cysteine ligase